LRILGLSGDYVRHDSSLCLVEDGAIIFASSEERFSKLKHDPRAPLGALIYLLEHYDFTMDDIDFVALGMPAFRVLHGIFGGNAATVMKSLLPLALKAAGPALKYGLDRISDSRPKRLGFEWLPRQKVRYVSHYLSHGASAYRTSGHLSALSVNLDAAGSDEQGRPFSGAVFTCDGGVMNLVQTISRYTSLGCFYNAVTQAVGFKPLGEDWKLMGLAAFGDPGPCQQSMHALAPDFERGRFLANQFSVEAKLIDRPLLLKKTRLWRRLSEMVDKHGDRDVAAAAQKVFEDILLKYFRWLLERYKHRVIVLAGGAFHNIKACMRLRQEFPGHKFLVHPAAGDPGTAVGAALELYHRLTGNPTVINLKSLALGAGYSESDMLAELGRVSGEVSWEKPADLPRSVAQELTCGRIVGLCQGRAEWGPRALGQRSVLADPRNPKARDHINLALKNREWFMPFAPSIVEEDGPAYLVNYEYSPFMTDAFPVTPKARREIPAAVHLDGTARPQIVRRGVLPHYHAIISAFRELTGVGAVLNTSFNRHGLPIVNDPRDAILHLLWGCTDVLALGPFLVRRLGPRRAFKKRLDWTADQIIGKWDEMEPRLLSIRRRRAEMGPKLDPSE